MEHHIVEILVFLTRQFPEGIIGNEDFEPVAKDLMGRGYSHQEIETALFWFNTRQEMRDINTRFEEFDAQSFRVLHEVERSVLSPQAYGYLIELRELKILSLSDMNAVIEKAMMIGSQKIGLDDIKMLVAAQILEQEEAVLLGQNFFIKYTSEQIH